jgi:AP-2 complex subunit alpha
MLSTTFSHPTSVKIGGYVLGEFGHVITGEAGCSPLEQFALLHAKFISTTVDTRCLLLNTYIKFYNLYPDVRARVMEVLQASGQSISVELQERACEYMALIQLNDPDILAAILEEMPPYPERQSALLLRLHGDMSEDRRAWQAAGWANRNRQSLVVAQPTKPKEQHGQVQDLTDGVDLLDLSDEPQVVVATQSQVAHVTYHPTNVTDVTLVSTDQLYYRLLITSSGTLFQSDTIQLIMQSEYQKQYGRMLIILQNVSNQPLQHISLDLSYQQSSLNLVIDPPFQNTILPASQSAMSIKLEALRLLSDAPTMRIRYVLGGDEYIHAIRLPVTITKFMEPVQGIGAQDFFMRWKQLALIPNNESQVVCKGHLSLSEGVIRNTLIGYGWGLLHDIDPNTNNFVAASVVHTTHENKYGCLLRFEPNYDLCMFRITIRSTGEQVCSVLTGVLEAFVSRGI